jgi:hypothetical protein
METVISCAKVKEWNGKPIYSVELSDGTKGESFQEIPVGTSKTEIEITPNGQYAAKFKWKQPGKVAAGFGGGKVRSGNESFALAYAKDVACAHIGQGKPFGAKEIVAVAEVFYTWLEGKKK